MNLSRVPLHSQLKGELSDIRLLDEKRPTYLPPQFLTQISHFPVNVSITAPEIKEKGKESWKEKKWEKSEWHTDSVIGIDRGWRKREGEETAEKAPFLGAELGWRSKGTRTSVKDEWGNAGKQTGIRSDRVIIEPSAKMDLIIRDLKDKPKQFFKAWTSLDWNLADRFGHYLLLIAQSSVSITKAPFLQLLILIYYCPAR